MSEQQFVTRYRLLDVYVLPESYRAIDTANDVLVSESSMGVVFYLNGTAHRYTPCLSPCRRRSLTPENNVSVLLQLNATEFAE